MRKNRVVTNLTWQPSAQERRHTGPTVRITIQIVQIVLTSYISAPKYVHHEIGIYLICLICPMGDFSDLSDLSDG